VYVVNVTGTPLKNSRKKLFASPRHGRRISRTQVAKEDEGKPITAQIWTFGSLYKTGGRQTSPIQREPHQAGSGRILNSSLRRTSEDEGGEKERETAKLLRLNYGKL